MNMFLLVAVTHSSELSLLVLNSRAAALELLWQCEIALTAMGKSLGKCDLKFEMEMLGQLYSDVNLWLGRAPTPGAR